MRLFLFIVVLGCGENSVDADNECPLATDSCMNDENHQACLDVVATCDGNLLIMESCPLQFGCDD